MEHFVTLFNGLYLPQGLALHYSLNKFFGNFTLWILCVDNEAFDTLEKLDLPHVRLILLSDVETEELIRAKGGRSLVEYLWTLTPFTTRYVFEADNTVQRATYLDADIWLIKNPAPIFEEFERSGKAVMITDHHYAPENDQSASSGQYCVQFMIFKRQEGEVIRKWWEERCIEWCYARFEDGKFGDQKYLDDWPVRFADQVHVLSLPSAIIAPWNATRFPYSSAMVYHFHGLRILKNGKFDLSGYPLPPVLVKYVYEPYLNVLRNAEKRLAAVGFEVRPQGSKRTFFQGLNLIRLGVKFQLWRFKLRNVQ